MLQTKLQWLALGVFMTCLVILPFHIKIVSELNNKYRERCMIAEVVIAEPFGGGNMRGQGKLRDRNTTALQ